MKERRTVVATTTRTRASRDTSERLLTRAFRVTPTGLADGLEHGSIRRPAAASPHFVVPPRPASGAGLRPRHDHTLVAGENQPRDGRGPPPFFARRRTCKRIGLPTKPNSSRSLLTRKRSYEKWKVVAT